MKKGLQLLLLSLALVLGQPGGATTPVNTQWRDIDILLGNWIEFTTGPPQQVATCFSFLPDLQSKVVFRRARTVYPSAQPRQKRVRDDLMVIYATNPRQAMYFDSEGRSVHLIHAATHDRTVVSFYSDSRTPPSYRLSFMRLLPDQLYVTFDESLSGKHSDFKSLLDTHFRRRPLKEACPDA